MNTHINTLGSTKLSNSKREDLDFYQTPSYAIKTLVEHFMLKSDFIWEPMAGNGAIAKELSARGYSVYSTDIIERKFRLNDTVDYFSVHNFSLTKDDFAIVTNPPYKYANDFLKHTLETIRPITCCVFLPVRYLEGKFRYNEIYSKYKPAKVLTYVKRLGCFTDKDIEEGRVTDIGVGSAVAYMWLCFDRDTWSNQDTKTELEWIA